MTATVTLTRRGVVTLPAKLRQALGEALIGAAMWVFLSANILFCAAKSDGAVRALLRLLLERGHECQVDAVMAAEARQVPGCHAVQEAEDNTSERGASARRASLAATAIAWPAPEVRDREDDEFRGFDAVHD